MRLSYEIWHRCQTHKRSSQAHKRLSYDHKRSSIMVTWKSTKLCLLLKWQIYMGTSFVTSDRCDPHKWCAHQWNRERPIFWPNKMIPTVFKVNVILTWDESYQAVQCYPIQCHLTNFDQLVIFSLPSCNKLGMAMKWLCEINKYYNANLDSEGRQSYHRSMLIKNWFGTPIPNG